MVNIYSGVVEEIVSLLEPTVLWEEAKPGALWWHASVKGSQCIW